MSNLTLDLNDPVQRAQALEYEQNLLRVRAEAKRIVTSENLPTREPLRALTFAELFARPAPEYLIDQLLPHGALAELIGDSETLKSFFAIERGTEGSAKRQRPTSDSD